MNTDRVETIDTRPLNYTILSIDMAMKELNALKIAAINTHTAAGAAFFENKLGKFYQDWGSLISESLAVWATALSGDPEYHDEQEELKEENNSCAPAEKDK